MTFFTHSLHSPTRNFSLSTLREMFGFLREITSDCVSLTQNAWDLRALILCMSFCMYVYATLSVCLDVCLTLIVTLVHILCMHLYTRVCLVCPVCLCMQLCVWLYACMITPQNSLLESWATFKASDGCRPNCNKNCKCNNNSIESGNVWSLCCALPIIDTFKLFLHSLIELSLVR